MRATNRDRKIIAGTAMFAMFWVIVRACLQSITTDEAGTYLSWVAPAYPTYWNPHSNNHVLNSVLMRFFTWAFGLSHLTARAPALIGGALYIVAVYRLGVLITNNVKLRWSLFVCMVYNPLIMDFLVAARGYSLATALLVWALLIAARHMRGDDAMSTVKVAALSSLCVGLSFTANFSFAFVDAAVMLAIFVWLLRAQGEQRLKLLAASVLPAVIVAVAITGSIALRISKSDLSYGTTSLRDMANTVIQASLYQVNSHLVNPLFLPALARLKRLLFPLLALLAICRFVTLIRRRRLVIDLHTRWLTEFGTVVAASAGLTLAAHWLAFQFFGILLPQDRTGIYFVPLCMLIAGALAAIPGPTGAPESFRRGLASVIFVMGLYFLLCLRANYFKSWEWGQDVKPAYAVLAYYNRTYGVREVGSNWLYSSSLNFYRKYFDRETLAEITVNPGDPFPLDRKVYVLNGVFDQDFIEKEKLKVVYRGENTDVVVAIRPEIESDATSIRRRSP